MDVVLAGLAGLVGLVVGAGAALSFRLSEREQRVPGPPAEQPALPPGVADVLAVLRSSAVVIDRDDQVVRASPAAYSFGLVRSNALVVGEILDLVRDVRRDGEIREAELEVAHGPLGTATRSVLVRLAPLSSTLVLVLVEDQTEAKRVERMRRDFLANVSHELKTPAGAIALLGEALLDAAEDPEAVQRFAGRLRHESDRLNRLVHDVIELSRLQVSDPLALPTLVELDDVVAEATDRCRLSAEARDIALVVGGTTRVRVMGDARQLVIAVGNLVENAVRYAPEGTRVAVTTALDDDAQATVAEISVTDEGPGIAAAELDRIFERFYRLDSARSRDTGGTGLGLSIVKHVAAAHGGDVRVWSDEGTGSTFTVRIPAATSTLSTEETP